MARSKMDCPYALRDEGRAGMGFVTMCDCPGGCEYKRETTKTKRGIVGECTKIFDYTGKESKRYYYEQ